MFLSAVTIAMLEISGAKSPAARVEAAAAREAFDERDALNTIVLNAARANGVQPKLLAAIVSTESRWRPWAVRLETKYRHVHTASLYAAKSSVTPDTERALQKMAFGLCQIVGGTARSLGYTGPLTELLDPEINANLGAKYLALLGKRYPNNYQDVISAYNAGSASKRNGKYSNQEYVNLVLSAMRRGQ